MAQQPLIEARESPGPGWDNLKPFLQCQESRPQAPLPGVKVFDPWASSFAEIAVIAAAEIVDTRFRFSSPAN